MSEPQHTPGPWHVELFSGNTLPHWKNQPNQLVGPSGEIICRFGTPPPAVAPEEERIQRSNNAFWMAHVPEMVEAIRQVKLHLKTADELEAAVDVAAICRAVERIPT